MGRRGKVDASISHFFCSIPIKYVVFDIGYDGLNIDRRSEIDFE